MMKAFLKFWNSYWFPSASLLDLAIVRLIVVGYQLFNLISIGLVRITTLPVEKYDSLPILNLIFLPFGLNYRPLDGVLVFIFYLTVTAGIFSFVGWSTNLSLMFFAMGNLIIHAFINSHETYISHNSGIMVIALFLLTLSPASQSISIDKLFTKSFSDYRDRFAKWPLLVIQWLLALAYFSAAKSKLVVGGFKWVNGYTLQYYSVWYGWDWLGQHHTVASVLSWINVMFESTFFLVLVFPILKWLYIPFGLVFHLGIFKIMHLNFLGWVALYSVFIPWTKVVAYLKQIMNFNNAKYDSLKATQNIYS